MRVGFYQYKDSGLYQRWYIIGCYVGCVLLCVVPPLQRLWIMWGCSLHIFYERGDLSDIEKNQRSKFGSVILLECSTLREFDSEYGTFCFVIVSMMVSLSFWWVWSSVWYWFRLVWWLLLISCWQIWVLVDIYLFYDLHRYFVSLKSVCGIKIQYSRSDSHFFVAV